MSTDEETCEPSTSSSRAFHVAINPDLTKKFQLPPSTQNGCILLTRLPLELRTIIWTHLLHSPRPLQFIPTPANYLETTTCFTWPDWRNVARPNFDLSPAILQTCQVAYREGVKFLHDSNTLTIKWTFDINHRDENKSVPGTWIILAAYYSNIRFTCEEYDVHRRPRENSQLSHKLLEIIDSKRLKPTDFPIKNDGASQQDYANVISALSCVQKLQIELEIMPLAKTISNGGERRFRKFKRILDFLFDYMHDFLNDKDLLIIVENERIYDMEIDTIISRYQNHTNARSIVFDFPRNRSEPMGELPYWLLQNTPG